MHRADGPAVPDGDEQVDSRPADGERVARCGW